MNARSATRFRPMLESFEDRMNPSGVIDVIPFGDVTEGGGGGLMLVRSVDTTGAITVNYSIGGTADSSDHSLGTSGTAYFADGYSVALVFFTPINDSTAEPTKTIVFTITSGTGYTIGTSNVATMNLLDDDTPVVSVEKIADATEGGDNGTFRFTRIGNLSSSLTANYTITGTATENADFTALSGAVTFAAHAAAADVSIATIDDVEYDPAETVVATVTSGSGYSVGSPYVATVTITDDEGTPVSESVWEWVATGTTLQTTDVPTNWRVDGLVPSTSPPNDGSAYIVVDPGTAPLEFTPALTMIGGISVPVGWGQMIQFDSGLEITGTFTSASTINDATLNILNASFTIDPAVVLSASNLLTTTLNAPVETVKIGGELDVRGKAGGNVVREEGPVELTGSISVSGNGDGSATYINSFGVTSNGGKLSVSGASAANSGQLDIYLLTMTGGRFEVGHHGTASITGLFENGTGDQNFPAASMIVKSGPNAGATVTVIGKLTTEYGLYIAPGDQTTQTVNTLFLAPGGIDVVLNGDVYTYGSVTVSHFLGGKISSDGNITINNNNIKFLLPGAVDNVPTWTCKKFTAAGNNGVTLSADIGTLPAESSTYQLLKTTGWKNSVSGAINKGKLNNAAYPVTWDAIFADDGQELDLTYTKPN